MTNVSTRQPGTATLLDGTVVPSDSEAWRAECAARAVAAWDPSVQEAYIARVKKKQGADAADRLRSVIEDVEAIIICDMPSRNLRSGRLARIQEVRGFAARKQAEQRVLSEWNRRK